MHIQNTSHHDSLSKKGIAPFNDVCSRRLLFVLGKGGVGKSVISQALALQRARQGSSSLRKSPTLHLTFEDPVSPLDHLEEVEPRLWHQNAGAQNCFEEYLQLKLKLPKFTSVLLKNKMIRYLSHATPGVKEVVLLGKAWAERMNYQQVICDMPATGHGLAMFKSVQNFTQLFRNSLISSDASEMLDTFSHPKKTGFLIVSLPEEMPLKESAELAEQLHQLFPENPPAFLVNKLFEPTSASGSKSKKLTNQDSPENWPTPLPENVDDYISKRVFREKWNLREWIEKEIPFFTVPFLTNRLTGPVNPAWSFDSLPKAVSHLLPEDLV